MKAISTVLIVFSLGLVSCRESQNSTVQPQVPDNAYLFTSYDTGGNVVDTGWLLMNLVDPNNISGSWSLSTQESGELRGSVDNGRVVIDLHPGMVDNNFVLFGTVQGKLYSGEWEKIGIAGIMASGTFVARQP